MPRSRVCKLVASACALVVFPCWVVVAGESSSQSREAGAMEQPTVEGVVRTLSGPTTLSGPLFSPPQVLTRARSMSQPVSEGSHSEDTAPAAAAAARRLRLYNTHTGERVDVVFRRGSEYVPEGLRRLELHLRDHRTQDIRAFDPALFDLLADLTAAAGRPDSELHVISGYRSPKTNEMLRERSSAVAKSSLHMVAQAIDIRLPGVSTAQLRDTALELGRGGVGYYQRSDFIHVDTGRVRRW